jgi:hypothetical protein
MSSVQLLLPIAWHPTGRPGHRLIQRVVLRRSQGRAFDEILTRVIPEPVLTRLVAVDDPVAKTGGVVEGVL